MLSLIIYLFLVFCLVYWIEGPLPRFANLSILKGHSADELEAWLKKFHWDHRQTPPTSATLPSYKFYSEVVEILLSLARKVGGSYQESLLFLREGLQADRQFEKRLGEMIVGCWLQIGVMIALTWGFIFGALSLVEVHVAPIKLFCIGGWQLLGLIILPLALHFLRQRYFSDIGRLWKMLYTLKSLTKVPLSRTEILHLAGVRELEQIKQTSLLSIIEKLKECCRQTLQQGLSYEQEVNSLMAELRFQEKWHFELFEKRLLALKLVLLGIFFLPSYLGFIFLLLNDLLALM
jgi:hypothetical protein